VSDGLLPIRLGNNERPILHSDQGWQYQMPAYRRRLQKRGIAQSMSRKGTVSTTPPWKASSPVLKSEFFHPNRFDSPQSLQAGMKEYIHNHQRIKLKLKGLSPVQYRTQSLIS
jgi:putative transposase